MYVFAGMFVSTMSTKAKMTLCYDASSRSGPKA
jgi:hypothetical protein